ncbi:MAG: aminotransferase class V-fold PLP-dependent enzyme [Planctomycetota bacterium]|nr:aminotransferase class V-fold PLP-dependent enzyme [Planctomycetota bacterium]
MSIYKKLGVEPIINATGNVTRLGGSRLRTVALEAYALASQQSVSLEHLQAAASQQIANLTGAEAGLITSGAAAGLTLGSAAILTGLDAGRMEKLPDTRDMPAEIIVAREHRSGYDHAVRASGAQLVEVGFQEQVAGAGVRRAEAWEYEAAIGDQTAGILYVEHSTAHPPLADIVAVAQSHNLPLLVDAAGELPPRENLRRLATCGADLVVFSGGKAIGGPQPTGILAGRRDLVAAAALQMLDMDDHPRTWDPPVEFIDPEMVTGMPRHGIGRSMKVSKEAICALLAALDEFVSTDPAEQLARWRDWLEQIHNSLVRSTANCQLVESPDGQQPPRLEIHVNQDAFELCRALRAGSPPIYVGHGRLDEGILVINPVALAEDEVPLLGGRLMKLLAAPSPAEEDD